MLLGALCLPGTAPLTHSNIIMKGGLALGGEGQGSEVGAPPPRHLHFLADMKRLLLAAPLWARTLYVNNTPCRPSLCQDVETRCPGFISLQTSCDLCFTGEQIPSARSELAFNKLGYFPWVKKGFMVKVLIKLKYTRCTDTINKMRLEIRFSYCLSPFPFPL